MDLRPRARLPTTAVAIAALTLIIAGCGGDDDATSAPTTTGAAAVTVPAPSTPERSDITDADVLPDGRWYGHITGIDLDGRTLTFDLAQWFSGDAATEAGRADGVIPEDDVASNDFYIRDNSHRLRTVPLAGDVTVTVVRCPTGCAQYAGELEPLAASFGQETNALDRQYHGNFLGYWLTVERGDVVRIDEQYTP